MAINSVILDLVLKVAAPIPRPCRMLCLGYPDMLVTEPQIAALCGAEALAAMEFREDSQSILRWHSLQSAMSRIPETRSLFRTKGIETEFVDIVASRGFEMVADLNQPLPEAMRGSFDIVYDGGTMEHCFNVGQVMLNITAMAKKGGYIVHVNPGNYYNHGFFNFNPTFYHDWYTQSGNRMASDCYALFGPVTNSQVAVLPHTQGFKDLPPRTVLMVAAQKLSDEEPRWPTQTKYLGNPTLKA
jgi:hypothetical protein